MGDVSERARRIAAEIMSDYGGAQELKYGATGSVSDFFERHKEAIIWGTVAAVVGVVAIGGGYFLYKKFHKSD